VSAGASVTPIDDTENYFSLDEEAKARGLFQLLREDGDAASRNRWAVTGIDVELARRLYYGMLTIRIMDERLLALQRQGRIGFYGEARGQEAAVIGSAAAMDRDDWLVPALREAGAGIYRGLPLSAYVAQIFGNASDISKGRQMPCHPCHRNTHYVVMSSCVGSQIPHAVGVAWAMKLAGDHGKVCVGYMGDGATSEADFHVAINFAGVSKAPIVLICQNNQWAISTPNNLQTASDTIALKGIGYGVESLRVDGNDVFATYLATKYALDKARRGDGPTFLELLTYRVSAHSSSDDPSRYRDESVTEVWRTERDPIARLRTFLSRRRWLTDEDHDRMAAEIEHEVRAVVAEQEKIGPPALDTIIEDVYETPPWHLREQLRDLKGE
jgi:pyruvate dehydrogenase E1 component alpha subunit/2-oxoisovalerate dehydrogenase E1 component alpha subunit